MSVATVMIGEELMLEEVGDSHTSGSGVTVGR